MNKLIELPNKTKIYVVNEKEALFLYDDIFVKKSYLKHGIILNPGNTVFDIGANIGLFSLFAYEYCQGDIKLFSFEPINKLYEILKKNTKNNININCGLWNEDTTAIFDYFPHYSLLSGADAKLSFEEKENLINLILNNLDKTKKNNGFIENIIRICPSQWKSRLVKYILENFFLKIKKCSVTLKNLSNIIKEYNLSEINLVKLDAEKAELKILEGIKSEDWQKIQQLVIEVHDIQDRLSTIKNILGKYGFEYTVDAGYQPKFLAYSILGVKEPIVRNHNSKELLYTIYAKRI